jgi:aminomethyltransferase
LSSVEATPAIRKTALNAVHRQMGAKMVDFNGWDMPVEYPASIGCGIINEHMAVRTGVGIFDVSHMGDIRLAGPQALAAVQHISMNDASRLAIGQAQYSALLYPEGTFVDDVIVHRLAEDEYLLVINAGTREKDFNWVRDNTQKFDCAVENLSDDFTQIAIQGPKAVNLLQKLTDAYLNEVKFYWVTRGTFCGLPDILIGRTGYTAEDGFEIYIPSDVETSAHIWGEILEAGKEFAVLPCGLGARNTLRLEGKLPLYGHEISDTINVWEAGLDRFCKMEKPEFIGRAALEHAKSQGIKRTLVGLEMVERGIARDDYKVQDESGQEIGYVTSGSPAPFLKKNIALAYVPVQHSAVGSQLKVEIRGQGVTAQVVPTPFYKRPKKQGVENVPEKRPKITAAHVLRSYTRDSLPDFGDGPITDVNQVASSGDRPIHIACIRGNLEDVVALVEAGADVNAAGEDGYTPLHWAATNSLYEIAQVLVSHGADVTAKNIFGQTPIDLARDRTIEILESAKKARS